MLDKEQLKVTYTLTYTFLRHPELYLSSNKAGSLGRADHDSAGAEPGP